MTLHEIGQDITQNWMLYASMPIVAAIIGYVTKLVAIRMMFQPLKFFGIKPWLGWQGIIPRRAEKMATIAVDLMMEKLITPQEVFDRLDPHRIAEEVRQPLLSMTEDITREVAAQYQPGLWESMPESVRKRVINRVQKDSPDMVEQIMEEIKQNLDKVFDLKEMVITNLTRDKELLNRIFRESGENEFAFIVRCGIYFGFGIGLIQVTAWAFTHNIWVMPLFGLFVGWFSDWMALKMIFNPKQPKRYFWIFKWQGLFLKNRMEVSAKYGDLVAKEIVTPHNIMHSILNGPLSDRLYQLIQRQVQLMVDKQAGIAKPMVVFSVGSKRYQSMKKEVASRLMDYLPETLSYMEGYAEEAMDLRNLLSTKLQQLSEEEFESLLRPAFQQDEWILIAVGAALGFMVGEMQVLVMEHFATPVAEHGDKVASVAQAVWRGLIG